jgi:hypothetical protein
VVKVYLAVQQSDSHLEFLQQVWPNVKRQIEIIFQDFDTDGDGVIRGIQQNTYDTGMQGANTFIGSYWITALKATAAMAAWMDDVKFAKKCSDRAELSATNYERICWKKQYGYYIADVDVTNCQHSYASGCCIDQLCAIGLSTACGLGTSLYPAHEAAARQAIFQNNIVTKPPFEDLQHHFYDGDSGVAICTYPHGKLPDCGIYDELVGTGFTYPFVAGLIYDGNLEAASLITKNIRARHSGIHRSPWNEPECGLLYSRSMASWNLFDQACGFSYDSTKAAIGYAPKMNTTNFSCFIIVQDGWGQFQQKGPEGLPSGFVSLQSLYGSIAVKTLQLRSCSTRVVATYDGSFVRATISSSGLMTLDSTLKIQKGSTLSFTLSSEAPRVSVPSKPSLVVDQPIRFKIALCCVGGLLFFLLTWMVIMKGFRI